MKLETKTPWEGITNYSGERVHPEYIPSIARVADRYRIPVQTFLKDEEPSWWKTDDFRDRKVLIGIGDSPRVLDLSPQEHNAFMYEFLLFTNYPG